MGLTHHTVSYSNLHKLSSFITQTGFSVQIRTLIELNLILVSNVERESDPERETR